MSPHQAFPETLVYLHTAEVRGSIPLALTAGSLLASIRTPVQFIWGADDPIGGEDVARAFAAQFSNTGLEVLQGAGHAPWIDYPDETAALTRSFVQN